MTNDDLIEVERRTLVTRIHDLEALCATLIKERDADRETYNADIARINETQRSALNTLESYATYWKSVCELLGRDYVTDRALDDLGEAVAMLNRLVPGHSGTIDEQLNVLVQAMTPQEPPPPPPPSPPSFPTALELAFEGGSPEIRRRLNDAVVTMRRAADLLSRGRNKDIADRCTADADAIGLIATMIKKSEG